MITLLTDFGLTDPYVAQMKGVIRTTNSDVEIVDISHGIRKHDIAMGSYILETTVSFFPKDTIHVAVVDPGVGGSRLPIVVVCDRGVLVGPDNGLLARASDRLGFCEASKIADQQFIREPLSSTFHGRDIFALTAAKLALSPMSRNVGPRVASIDRLNIPKPGAIDSNITCAVLYVDSFGNVVTNISEELLSQLGIDDPTEFKVTTSMGTHEGLVVRSYSELPKDQLGLILGSQGYLEIAAREGSAAAGLLVEPLNQLKISFR